MVEVIPINITAEELAQRAERVARARRFEPVERVPVCPNLYVRYWLPKVGIPFESYFSDPETMLRGQILGQKWVLENIQCDLGFNAGYVDFQNAQEASALGCETVVSEGGSIWIEEGWLRSEADLDKLRRSDPMATGLAARALAFAEQMRALSERYVVRFKDGTEIRPAEHPTINAASMGPFTLSAELVGLAEFCAMLYERPDFARELLALVTDKIIYMLDVARRRQGMDALWMADDYVGNLSLPLFRAFVLPCLQRIRDHFAGLRFGFHLCGKVDHLLVSLADELRINEFALFGYQVDKQRVQQIMGGRIVLTGNVNPMNLYAGTPETVREEALEALRVFGRGPGGFILCDGANIAPDTPVENINALWDAACQFAAEA